MIVRPVHAGRHVTANKRSRFLSTINDFGLKFALISISRGDAGQTNAAAAGNIAVRSTAQCSEPDASPLNMRRLTAYTEASINNERR
jgi:hypothetical protein